MATKTVARLEAEPAKKVSRAQAASKIAALIEKRMTECGFSQKQKNGRVADFGKRVDEATARHARR